MNIKIVFTIKLHANTFAVNRKRYLMICRTILSLMKPSDDRFQHRWRRFLGGPVLLIDLLAGLAVLWLVHSMLFIRP